MRKLLVLALTMLVLPISLLIRDNKVVASDVTYDIHPTVHEIEYGNDLIQIPEKIQLNIKDNIDKYTKQEAYDILSIKNVVASSKDDFSSFKLSISIYNDGDEDIHFNKLDAYTLDINEDGIDIVGKDDESCFYALQTLREIFKQSNESIRKLSIKDYSNSLYRGVIEGLYGVPYNNFEIIDMIDFISYYKGNSFFYGPRHDSYFRTAWRELLPSDELIMLEEIVSHAKQRKVNFYFGLNPVETHSFTMANYANDLEVFLARFEQTYSVGVRNFFISADDVMGETVEPELHLKFMNDLANWAKDKGDCGRIVLTPSCYCGNGDNRLGVTLDYLSTFKERLDETVDMFWTGYEVTSSISTGDFERFYDYTGRKPVFWLNWPVNDYAPTRIIMSKGEMLDVTYENEDAPFLGVISNPQVLPYPSNLAIYQCLDYSWNYKDFDLDNCFNSAFERIEENEPEAFKQVSSYLANATMYLENRYFEESPKLKALIEEYNSLKEENASLVEVKAKIREELNTTITAVDTLLNNGKNRNLIDQLKPYMLAVKDTCIATLRYLELEDIIINKETNLAKDKIIEANDAYNKIKENKDIVLDYVTCNEDYKSVEVCNAVLTPFLNKLIAEIDYDAKLMAGLPTGIIYRGFNSIYSGTYEDMFDNNEDTWLMLDGYAGDGSYLQIDLEEVTSLTSLKVVYKNQFGEYCYFPKVEISIDGIMYQPLANVNSNVIDLDLRDTPIDARFIRLSNFTGEALPWWISIAEVKVNYLAEDEIKVTTNGINGIYEGDVGKMFDGDSSTYCWFNDYPAKDAYIQIDYRKVIELTNLSITFKNAYAGSLAFMPCIEYSLDGKTFTKLSDVNSNSVFVECLTPIKFRYLRLTNNTGNRLDKWVSVAEISLNINLPQVDYVGFSGVYSGSSIDLFDNNDNTFLWFASGAETDGYVTLTYQEEMSASSFRIVFYNGFGSDYSSEFTDCYLSNLEVSLDGLTWTTLEANNSDNEINVMLEETITFKYIRIKNGSGSATPHWVSIASVEFE